MDEATTTQTDNANAWRGFRYYATWWVIIMSIASGLSFVETAQNFWAAKSYQVGAGALFGLVCAIVFTFSQNVLNPKRRKVVSWVLAIAIWMLLKLPLSLMAS